MSHGQVPTPRHARHTLLGGAASLDGSTTPATAQQQRTQELFGGQQHRAPVGTGLGSELVVEVATSRYFSVARTSSGGVWTCGTTGTGLAVSETQRRKGWGHNARQTDTRYVQYEYCTI